MNQISLLSAALALIAAPAFAGGQVNSAPNHPTAPLSGAAKHRTTGFSEGAGGNACASRFPKGKHWKGDDCRDFPACHFFFKSIQRLAFNA